MPPRTTFTCLPIRFLAALALGSPALGQEPLELGGARQLFLDDHLVAATDGVRFELGTLRDEGAVFHFDRSWEGRFSGYSAVLRDVDRYLLYYRGLPEAGGDNTNREVTCVALSEDGRTWTRPELGLFEVDGSRQNNIVLAGAAPASHNFTPFLDTRPGVDPAQRFKALAGSERSGLMAFVSADGLRWERLGDGPVLTDGEFDSQNVAFWSESEGRYACYFRTWTGEGYSGFRTVSRATSPDFVNWSEPVEMTLGDGPPAHVYTHQTSPYFRAPEIYVSIGARFFPGRRVVPAAEAEALGVHPRYGSDCSDAVLMTTRGGDAYDRTFREAFLRPGIGLENWTSRSNFPALGLVQTGPAEMSLFVNQNYAQPTAELRRYSMRLDGLASLRAPADGGEWTSRPLVVDGRRLELNLATSAGGGVRVELQDEAGRPLPGYSLDDCYEVIGNDLARTVRWSSGADLGWLAGRVVRLRMRMADADLYSLRLAPDAPQPSAAERALGLRLRSVERIWDAAPHSAFTDLLQDGDRLLCAFREGEGHALGEDGRIRVIARDPGGPWLSVALLEEPGVDLRDPKLSRMPDGRVMLLCGGSVYEGSVLRSCRSRVYVSESGGESFGPAQPVVLDEAVRSEADWLWRVTWVGGEGYGVVYQPLAPEPRRAHLVATNDGVSYRRVTTFDLGDRPTEVALREVEGGDLLAIVRHDGKDRRASLGRSAPPFEEWRFQRLGEHVGGPDLLMTGRLDGIVGGRRFPGGVARTALSHLGLRLDGPGPLGPPLILPSAGDTSYPGMVRSGEELLVSYYSSHEGRTAIYLATLEPLTESGR